MKTLVIISALFLFKQITFAQFPDTVFVCDYWGNRIDTFMVIPEPTHTVEINDIDIESYQETDNHLFLLLKQYSIEYYNGSNQQCDWFIKQDTIIRYRINYQCWYNHREQTINRFIKEKRLKR